MRIIYFLSELAIFCINTRIIFLIQFFKIICLNIKSCISRGIIRFCLKQIKKRPRNSTLQTPSIYLTLLQVIITLLASTMCIISTHSNIPIDQRFLICLSWNLFVLILELCQFLVIINKTVNRTTDHV